MYVVLFVLLCHSQARLEFDLNELPLCCRDCLSFQKFSHGLREGTVGGDGVYMLDFTPV